MWAQRQSATLTTSHRVKELHPECVAAVREIGISPGAVEDDGIIGPERRATAPWVETGLVSWKARKEEEERE